MTEKDDLGTLWVEHRVLRQDFYTHEAVVEERWKTIFNELAEVKDSVRGLQRLVLAVSGTAIVLMAGWIATLLL